MNELKKNKIHEKIVKTKKAFTYEHDFNLDDALSSLTENEISFQKSLE